jgi:predicted chitinase
MAKIILTENQLTDLIRSAVEKITGASTKNSSLKDIFKDFGVDPSGDLGNLFKDDKKLDFKSFEGKTKIGKVKLKGNFSGEQKANIDLLIKAMENKGIKNPYTQIGILSVIGKETNFIPKSEVAYSNTSNSRIRKIFGSRVAKYSDSQLNTLKNNPEKFFNVVYAKTVGNQGGGDGWKYRGRGFNQLTGKKNYEKYGNMVGVDILSNPDRLNNTDVAAKVALAFFTKGKPTSTFPNFDDKVEAAIHFADINAGGGVSSHRQNAIDYSEKFDVA